MLRSQTDSWQKIGVARIPASGLDVSSNSRRFCKSKILAAELGATMEKGQTCKSERMAYWCTNKYLQTFVIVVDKTTK